MNNSQRPQNLRGMKDNFIYMVRSEGERKLTDFIVKDIGGRLKLRYGEELFIIADNNNYPILEKVNKWIEEHDKNYSKRIDNSYKLLRNTQFIIKLDTNTFALIQVGEEAHSFNDIFRSNGTGYNNEDIKMYIFGKYYKKYYDELFEIAGKQKDNNTRYIYNVSGGQDRKDGSENMHSIVQSMHKRDIATLFYNKGIKEEILTHIDSFIDNKSIYDERDLLYKTGILLYGEPGTGKTSLATALATYYGYDLVCVDMGSFDRLDLNTLTSCINCDTSKFIILLEDIDCLYNLDRNSDGIDKDDKKVINKMLQFLDSNNSPRDVIFIATTNHVEKLDPAILRDGRFDLKVEITQADRDTAIQMCKSFNISDEEVEIILRGAESFPINQSKLQNMILDYFKKGSKENV